MVTGSFLWLQVLNGASRRQRDLRHMVGPVPVQTPLLLSRAEALIWLERSALECCEKVDWEFCPPPPDLGEGPNGQIPVGSTAICTRSSACRCFSRASQPEHVGWELTPLDWVRWAAVYQGGHSEDPSHG